MINLPSCTNKFMFSRDDSPNNCHSILYSGCVLFTQPFNIYSITLNILLFVYPVIYYLKVLHIVFLFVYEL